MRTGRSRSQATRWAIDQRGQGSVTLSPSLTRVLLAIVALYATGRPVTCRRVMAVVGVTSTNGAMYSIRRLVSLGLIAYGRGVGGKGGFGRKCGSIRPLVKYVDIDNPEVPNE